VQPTSRIIFSVPRLTHAGAGQTIYFLLTDRFANGNPANDTGGMPGGPDVSGFDPTRISTTLLHCPRGGRSWYQYLGSQGARSRMVRRATPDRHTAQ